MARARRTYSAVRSDHGLIYSFLGSAAALGELALGPEAMSAYMGALGLLAGAEVEDFYRKRWDVWVPLTPAKYGYLVTELYGRMEGRASLVSVDGEKVVVEATHCPYAGHFPAAESLCGLDKALFGSIAARNFGYAKVVSRRRLATGGGGCELAIYIKRVPGADRDEGVEYVVGSLPFGGDRGERTTVGQRVAVVGRELRERLLGLDTPMERTRLLADAAGLFEPVGKMEDLHQRIVALGPGQLGEACALYLQADGGRGEVAAVHHADPTVSEALRPLLRVDALGEVGRSMGEGGPFLARDLADEALAMPKETVQALAGLGLASALVAPLVVGTRRLGAILCMAGGQRRLEARDLLLAVRFAGLASAAIEAARRHETLKGMVSSSETFTSSAFHELLNGLSRLKSLTQISSRALEAGKPEGVARVERNLEAMCRHLDLMAGLIRDMSDALAISTRGIELHRERTNLNTLIADVVGRFQGVVAEQSNCRLCCELPAAQIIGMWDRTRVEQLLTNLLANAVNYSPGGGLITVSLEETSTAGTECGLGQEGAAPARAGRRMAVVTVRDEGIGVPADQHALVFAPFSKASNAKESHQGAGLGLFICRGIAEAHGGRVWLDSQVGKGSAFHFSLPLEEPRAR